MARRNLLSWFLLPLLSILQACSTFPQLVRHSDPLTPEQHMQLGAAYEAQGLTGPAGEQYEAALHLQKRYIPALIARGNLAFANGDLKTAELNYRRVLSIEPNHVGANNNLAMAYLSRGKDLERAERYALTALKQGGPLRPYVQDTLASIYLQQNRLIDAGKILDEADQAASSDNPALCEQLSKTREKLSMNR